MAQITSRTFRPPAEVYPQIKASNGRGGLASGRPSTGDADLSIQGLGELYNNFELSSRVELHDLR